MRLLSGVHGHVVSQLEFTAECLAAHLASVGLDLRFFRM